MKVFVTGANGFLGSHLVPRLNELKHDVISLVRDWVGCELVAGKVYGDITDFRLLKRSFAEYEIETVFHLAAQAQVSVAETDPIGTFRSNIEGTWNVLQAAREVGVKHVIVASSDKVYDIHSKYPWNESDPIQGFGAYSVSKAAADLIAQQYMNYIGMGVSVTRCANLYGPGQLNYSTLIPGTIRSALRGERPIIRSDGTYRREYLYVQDAVEGYIALMNNSENGVWNFGTGNTYSVIEVVKIILGIIGSDLDPDIRNTCNGEIRHQSLDGCKARRVLKWTHKVGLQEGLAKTIEYYRGIQ